MPPGGTAVSQHGGEVVFWYWGGEMAVARPHPSPFTILLQVLLCYGYSRICFDISQSMYSTIASDRELKHNTMNSCQHQTVFGLIHSQSLSKMSSASSTERGSKQDVNLSLAIEEETGSNRHEIGRGRGADCFASAQRSRTTM